MQKQSTGKGFAILSAATIRTVTAIIDCMRPTYIVEEEMDLVLSSKRR